MASAIDVLLDQVDWTCANCGVSMTIGCPCWDRTTAAQKQTVATAIRKRFQVVLRTQYRPLYENRSARISLPNHLFNMVVRMLRQLDRRVPREYGMQEGDLAVLVADIRLYWQDYVASMYNDAWEALGEKAQAGLVQAVEAIVGEELGGLVASTLRVAPTEVC